MLSSLIFDYGKANRTLSRPESLLFFPLAFILVFAIIIITFLLRNKGVFPGVFRVYLKYNFKFFKCIWMQYFSCIIRILTNIFSNILPRQPVDVVIT